MILQINESASYSFTYSQGGGTYGIVWSVTVKAHGGGPATLAFLNFSSDGVSPWEALQTYLALAPKLTDAQLVSSAMLMKQFFSLSPLFGFNKTSAEVATLIDPLLKKLDDLGIEYTHSTKPIQTTLMHTRI